MDALRGLPSVIGSTTVQERRGSQKQADAFRKALQQEAGSDGNATTDDPAARRAPARRQRLAPADDTLAHHVDVVA